MIYHDPSELVRGLQQILTSNKKRIGFLFGAGTSMCLDKKYRLPGIAQMTEEILAEISSSTELPDSQKYSDALSRIKMTLENASHWNIEYLLSDLEQKEKVVEASDTLNGLNKDQIQKLCDIIKSKIHEKVSIHEAIKADGMDKLVHVDFTEWIGQAHRYFPIEIFTTNYDLLFELGLESNSIPYFDGFMGAHEPFFVSEIVDDHSFMPQITKLWKIHGSLGWRYDDERKRVLRGCTNSSSDLLIYPSVQKYNNSKKQPYTSLIDRLYRFLRQDDTVLFVFGYSFGDEHLNERIMTALKSGETSHVYGFLFDEETCEDGTKNYCLGPDNAAYKLAKSNSRLSLYGLRSAVIGCKPGQWKLKNEPTIDDTIMLNTYFDEDAAIDTETPISVVTPAKKGAAKTAELPKGKEKWDGTGNFILPRFEKFVDFLHSMIAEPAHGKDK